MRSDSGIDPAADDPGQIPALLLTIRDVVQLERALDAEPAPIPQLLWLVEDTGRRLRWARMSK